MRSISPCGRSRLRSSVICPLVIRSGVVPSRGARWRRRTALVKPCGSRRKTHKTCRRASERGSVRRSPATRVPAGVMTGLVTWAGAAAPAIGSWLSVWAPSRRRLAVKPVCRSAGRLASRLPIPKSLVPLMVVSVLRALLSLWYLLDLRVLVAGVQARGDPVGDDPGAEPARGGARALADDAAAEDQADLVGPAKCRGCRRWPG